VRLGRGIDTRLDRLVQSEEKQTSATEKVKVKDKLWEADEVVSSPRTEYSRFWGFVD